MPRIILLAPALAAALLLSACSDSISMPAPASVPTTATEAVAAAMEPEAALKNFELLDNAKGIYSGKGAARGNRPAAYILFDPQCSHCADLWHNAKPLQDEVVVKWIPVGVLNRDSVIQAAMLLEATDPLAMMTQHEDEYAATRHPSKATADVKIETVKMVEQNTSLLDAYELKSVPTIIYSDRLTHQPTITTGALPTEKLEELFGAKPHTTLVN